MSDGQAPKRGDEADEQFCSFLLEWTESYTSTLHNRPQHKEGETKSAASSVGFNDALSTTAPCSILTYEDQHPQQPLTAD